MLAREADAITEEAAEVEEPVNVSRDARSYLAEQPAPPEPVLIDVARLSAPPEPASSFA